MREIALQVLKNENVQFLKRYQNGFRKICAVFLFAINAMRCSISGDRIIIQSTTSTANSGLLSHIYLNLKQRQVLRRMWWQLAPVRH